MMLITTLSTRNCVSTSDPRAPIAMRMPISRVRSVTETSMMFMMPMPPTTSDIDAIAASRPDITDVVLVAAAAISVWLRTVKSSGESPSLCVLRMMSEISDCAAGMSPGENVLTRIWPSLTFPLSRFCAVVYGIRTTSSWSVPVALWPFGASTALTVNGTWPIWICAPTASTPGKRLFATVAPRSAILRAAFTSVSSNRSPEVAAQSRMVK
jgi:hypothetical protein